jgi:hypothetical protein
MNDTPAPEPLASDVVDELLSALLDDDFDAAAADAGMRPDEARARLAVTPGVAERTRALEAARAELAKPAPLDTFTRRRLVDRALPVEFHDERNRVGQWLLGAAGIAAAIAIVFALLVLPGRNGDGDDSASVAASPTVASTANGASTAPQTGDAIDDERALQQFVAAARSRTNNFAARDAPSSPPGAPADRAQRENAPKAAGASALDAAARCNPLIASELGLGGARLTQTSAVTHDGNPAIVVIYTRDDGAFGFLYDPTTCKVLISTFSK